jgi:hypothetical protein
MASNSIASITTSHTELVKSGNHTLDLWLLEPGIPLQKIVVNLRGVRPSHLEPAGEQCRLNRRL